MPPPGLMSAHEVLLYYDTQYFELIDSGRAYPYIQPWASVGPLLVLAYLLVDHRRSRLLSALRLPLYILLCIVQGWYLLKTKARNPASGFGIGLLSALGVMWFGVHMAVNDCQKVYRRIERRASSRVDGGWSYYWQDYPIERIRDRADWITDMFFNFRGIGWSWETNGVPPAPQWLDAALKGEDIKHELDVIIVSKTGIRRMSRLKDLLWDVIPKAMLGYVILDGLKTMLELDPYFWGYTDAVAPSHYPNFIQESRFLLKWTRLSLTMCGVYTALWTIYKLGPILFAGILGPRWFGLRAEPFMNPPDQFGSFSNVLDKGLAGLWGGWWHQTFRYGFEAPVTKVFNVTGIDKRSQTGKLLGLFLAFLISGCLHSSGSYTQLGDNRPLRGPMCFFLTQGLGIAIEGLIVSALKSSGIKLPRMLEQARNLGFVLFWMYYTAPLLADDFAQGGVWLFEPVPISLFRGLGLGAAESGWWCWWYGPIWWHTGSSWWNTGIAL